MGEGRVSRDDDERERRQRRDPRAIQQEKQERGRIELDERPQAEDCSGGMSASTDGEPDCRHDGEHRQRVEVAAAPDLDQHQRIPGVDRDPGKRQTESPKQRHEHRQRGELGQPHRGLHRHRAVRRERIHDAKEELSSWGIDRLPRRVVQVRVDPVIAERGQVRRARCPRVGADPGARHASIPHVPIGIGRKRGWRH